MFQAAVVLGLHPYRRPRRSHRFGPVREQAYRAARMVLASSWSARSGWPPKPWNVSAGRTRRSTAWRRKGRVRQIGSP